MPCRGKQREKLKLRTEDCESEPGPAGGNTIDQKGERKGDRRQENVGDVLEETAYENVTNATWSRNLRSQEGPSMMANLKSLAVIKQV